MIYYLITLRPAPFWCEAENMKCCIQAVRLGIHEPRTYCEAVFQWSFSLFLCVLFVVHQLASLVCVAHRQSVVCCVVIYKDLFCDERPQTARVAHSRIAQNMSEPHA